MLPIQTRLIVDKLPDKFPKVHARLLAFNPAKMYDRIKGRINVYKRQNTMFDTFTLFPNKPGKCACGCRKKLTGRRTRYATDDCKWFVLYCYWIVYGQSDWVRRIFINLTDGGGCMCCGNVLKWGEDEYAEKMGISYYALDHIVAVVDGGGGCWLGNYQLICRACHNEKTKEEAAARAKKRKAIS